MRLIDADALKAKSRRCFVDGFHGSGIYGETDVVMASDIENAPTVDAMPLPCKLGDPVYIIVNLKSGNPSHIVERKCTGIHIVEKVMGHRAEKARRYLVTNSDIGFAEHTPFAKIGELVFFTREEAEAALAERKTKDGC